jgi:hypothetical protein
MIYEMEKKEGELIKRLVSLPSLQGCGDLLQGFLLVCLADVLGCLLRSKIDGVPARIDMQMKVEDLLTGSWLIGLRQVPSHASPTLTARATSIAALIM